MWVGAQGATEPEPFCLITDILAHAANNPARGTRADALGAIGAAVRDSIKAHHVADVPVGMFLSAGIDSALITALSMAHGERPHTLTLAFAEYVGTANDESPLAEQLAAQLGTRHTTVMVRKADFIEQREQLLAAMDQPSIDGINTWFMAQAAASQGIKVALSGLGGDELFASYPSFAELPRIRNLARPFARWPSLGKTLRRATLPMLSRITSPKYAGLLEHGGTLGGAYLLRRSLYMPWELGEVLDADLARQGWQDLQCRTKLDATTAGIPQDRLAISALEMSWYMRQMLLRDSDWASMAQSLELRVPFLDVPLLRAVAPCLAAHPSLTKSTIASALAPKLPPALVNKPKTGFTVPVRDWLMGGDEFAEHPRGLRGWAGVVYDNADKVRMPPRKPQRADFALWSPEMATSGGIQSYMWRLWEMLATISETHGSRINGLSLMDKPESLAAWTNPVQAKPLGASGSKTLFMRFALSRSQGADIVVVGHLHLAPAAWLARRLGRIKRYLVVLHGIEAWERATLVQRFGLRHADLVVATTRYTAQTCAEVNGLPGQNFKVIPLCAEPTAAIPDPNFVLDGEFPILFVGRLATTEKYKGLETLMRAISRLIEAQVPCKLHVIGDGNDLPRLQALAPSLKLSDDTIRFYGRVSDTVLQAAYASAKVFAMPSAKEGFGIVFIEAMRHGVVCIGGEHGGTPEVFKNKHEGLLVEYGNEELLAAHLRNVIEQPAMAHALGIAGQIRFGQDYTFECFVARWYHLLMLNVLRKNAVESCSLAAHEKISASL